MSHLRLSPLRLHFRTSRGKRNTRHVETQVDLFRAEVLAVLRLEMGLERRLAFDSMWASMRQ